MRRLYNDCPSAALAKTSHAVTKHLLTHKAWLLVHEAAKAFETAPGSQGKARKRTGERGRPDHAGPRAQYRPVTQVVRGLQDPLPAPATGKRDGIDFRPKPLLQELFRDRELVLELPLRKTIHERMVESVGSDLHSGRRQSFEPTPAEVAPLAHERRTHEEMSSEAKVTKHGQGFRKIAVAAVIERENDRSIGEMPRRECIQTDDLEAFQLYSQAHEAQMNVRYNDARELFEQAVEIDPSFAMAYRQLSFLAMLRGEMDLARDYISQAHDNLDRLPERQKLLVQAAYAAQEEQDLEESVQFLEKLTSLYPDELEAYLHLSVTYDMLGRKEERLSVLERGVNALPDSGPLYNMYGYSLLWDGRYVEGIRALENYARLSPNEPNPYDSLGEGYLITGQPEKAIKNYTRALQVDPDFHIARLGLSYAYAILGRYDEVLDEARKLSEFAEGTGFSAAAFHFEGSLALSRVGRYRDAEEERKRGIEAALELLPALYALEQGRSRDAIESVGRAEALVQQLDSLTRRLVGVPGLLLAGSAEARAGNLTAAQARLEQQRQLMDSDDEKERWWQRALEGEIALAANDLSAAEAAFIAGEPRIKMVFSFGGFPGIIGTMLANNLPFHDGLARVKKARGDLPGAIEIYRDLLTPGMSSKWTAWLEPRYVLELARLLDETGDKEGAGKEYERFLELWKDADAELPELKEARAYVAK